MGFLSPDNEIPRMQVTRRGLCPASNPNRVDIAQLIGLGRIERAILFAVSANHGVGMVPAPAKEAVCRMPR
ncbi:hypothetical protein VTN96DRAFT_9669 [Rasamsonia emersonii]